MNAVHRLAELLGWRIPGNTRRQGIVIDLIQWNAVGAPTAFECSRVGIVYDHPLVQVTIRDVQLVRALIQFCRSSSAQEKTCLLIVLFLLFLLFDCGPAMAK